MLYPIHSVRHVDNCYYDVDCSFDVMKEVSTLYGPRERDASITCNDKFKCICKCVQQHFNKTTIIEHSSVTL